MHFGTVKGGNCDATVESSEKSWLQRLQLLDLYARWMQQHNRCVSVLVPSLLRDCFIHQFAKPSPLHVVWYEPGRVPAFSTQANGSLYWIVNGKFLPLIEWSAARSATRRHRAQVVVFSTSGPEAASYYPESVRVTDTGEVLRIQRHYFDSPNSTKESMEEACFLACRRRQLIDVALHLTQHGWGQGSIGALTKSMSVRWAPTPCVLSTFAPAQVGVHSDGPRTHIGMGSPNDSPVDEDSTIVIVPASGTIIAGRAQTVGHLMNPSRGNRGYLFTKRLIDLTLATAALVALFPFLMVIAILIKVTSRGPILFGHKRQGLGGKEFLCWKFRSMQAGSEKLQDELRRHNEVDGPQFKIKCDPRLTPFGDWIRRNNIDELPQLLNVILGQMSLVGPRPSPDKENQLCPAWRRARLSMKPGITGLWQVLRIRDEDQSDFQEWIYYDLEYANHRSTRLDLQLILHTPFTMFFSSLLTRLATRLERRGICTHSSRIHRLRKSA